MPDLQVENNNKAVNFITSEGLKLVGIGAKDIVDHKLKLILGLIWTLILRYQIQQGSGDDSPKKALLEWVNNQIRPYGLQVGNFTADWQDARALSALCDSLSPGVLLSERSLAGLSSPFKDADRAMDVAQQHYEIPKILDPADLVELPEELSIITYVSYYRDWLEKKADKEAQRLLRAAYPAYCYAYGPGLEAAATNEPAIFTIQAVNVYEDKLGHGGEHFAVEIVPAHGDPVIADIKDAGNGTYPVTYTPLLPGDYTVTVTLHGEKIKDMPVTVKVVGADAASCNAFGPGLQGANVGKPAPFKIRARNALGEELRQGGDKFVVTVTGAEALGEIPVKDNGDGSYDVVYHPAQRGTYTVAIQLRGEHIANSPVDVVCRRAVPENSWAEGPGLGTVRSHHPATFTIHALDIDGQPAGAGEQFEVQVRGPEVLPATVVDNGDGTYTATYEPRQPGAYEVEVLLYDEPIKDMPASVTVLAAADPGKSYAEGPGLDAPQQAEPAVFTIHAVDHAGAPRTDGGEHFEVQLRGPESLAPHARDNGDGTYTVEYTAAQDGEYEVAVSHEGAPIKDMPRRITVTATPSALSYADGPGLDGEPSTHHAQQFTIHAVNQQGKPLSRGGHGPAFTVTLRGPGGATLSPAVKDNGDGTYGVEYTVETAGPWEVLAQYKGAPIKDMPRTVNIKAAPSAGNSYAEGPGLEEPNTHHEQTFTIHAVDHDGKPVPHGGDEFVVSASGPEALDFQQKDNGDGTYTVNYTATKAGDYVFDIKLEGASIKDQPKPVHIKAFPDAGQSYAEGPGLEEPNTHHQQTFTIHAVDHDGKPVPHGGDEFVVSASGPEALDFQQKDNGDGTYTVTYTATADGDYVFDIKLEGLSIKDQPKPVHIKAAPSGNSYADGPGLTESEAGPNTHHEQTFTIHAVDHEGKPVGHGGDPFLVSMKLGGAALDCHVHDNSDGTYTVKYTAEHRGTYDVDVTLEGQSIKDMPRQLPIKAAPSAANSYAEGPGLEKPNTHHEQTFTIHAIGADGEPVGHGGDMFDVKLAGPAGPVDVAVKDNGDGTYTATYTATAPGDHTLAIEYEGAPIKDTPRTIFVEAAPSAGNSYAEGPGLEEPNTHHEQTFTIHAVDHDGKPVPHGGDEFVVSASGPEALDFQQKDNGDGTYTVNYTATKAGDYVFDIKLEGASIKDQPKPVHIKSSPDASKSYAEGPGLEAPTTHHEQTFTIHAVDHEGAPVGHGGDKFDVKIAGPEGEVPADVKDNGDGTYTVEYEPTAAGDYEVAVEYEGQAIKDTPKKLHIRGTPDASQSWAEGPGLEAAQTLHETHFTIHAVGHDGQPLTVGGDKFDVSMSGPADVPCQVADKNDGTYMVTYTAEVAGTYAINVQYEGKAIKDMPKEVAVRPSPNAANSYAEGPGLEKPSTYHPQQFTIHAVDVNGTPLSQGGDTFTATLKGPADVPVTITDNGDGTYLAEYETTEPGDYRLDVQYEGDSIKAMPLALTVLATPSAQNSYAEGPGIDGGPLPVWQTHHEQNFTIHAVDAKGQPRSTGGDTFKVSILLDDVSQTVILEPQLTDNNDGTYTVKYTPTVPGPYAVDITYEEQSIKDLPRSIKIQAAPDAGQSWAEGPGLEDGKVFDNEETHFTIHAVDHSGQPRTSGGDTFDVSIAGPFDVKPAVLDNGDGTYHVTYSAEEAGQYTINVQYEGAGIKDAPWQVTVREGADASKSRASFSLTVQAHDKRGNPKTFGGDKFTVALVNAAAKGDANRVKAQIETVDNGDGSYTANYIIEGEGQFKLAVKINGHHVDGSPFNQNRGTGSSKAKPQ